MANNYYTFTPSFTPGAKVRSDAVNAQYLAIEAAFDALPAAVDAITLGKTTFAPETGSGNAYVVTMPNTRTANADGDEVIFFATHANTGATTLNVDGIGAVTLTDRTGAALVAADIVNGRLYTATYDATNVRFVLDTTLNVVNNIIDTVQGSSTDNPAAPGTFDSNLAFENASAAALASIGFNTDIDLSIKNVVTGGKVIVEHGGFIRTATEATTGSLGGFQIRSDASTDTEQRGLVLAHQNGTERAYFGFNSDANLTISNAVSGGSVHVEHGGVIRTATEATTGILGGFQIRSNGNTDVERRALTLCHQDGTQRAYIGYTSSDTLSFTNKIGGGPVVVAGLRTGELTQGGIGIDPDGISSFQGNTFLELRIGGGGASDLALLVTDNASLDTYYNNIAVTKTKTAATGGLEVNNTQTGAGFERVLTQSDSARTSTTAALVAIANAINTAAEKEAGFMVFNTTTSLPVWAVGNTDGAVWVDATGATAHTPA